jgi:hypothetical protein
MLEKRHFDAAMVQVDTALDIGRRALVQRDEARRQLAEAQTRACHAEDDLRQATEAVRLLIALVRSIPTDYWPHEWGGAWLRLPAWLRREIER